MYSCSRTFTKYYTFRKHVHRDHPHILNTNNVERQDFPLAGNDDVDVRESLSGYEADGVNLDAHHKLRLSAVFQLRVKEVDGISQSGIDRLVNDITDIVHQTLDEVKAQSSFLAEEEAKRLSQVLYDPVIHDPYCSLCTVHLQNKAYKELFGLIVSLTQCSVLMSCIVKISFTVLT